MDHECKIVNREITVGCPFCGSAGHHFYRTVKIIGGFENDPSMLVKMSCCVCFRKFFIGLDTKSTTKIKIFRE